MRYYIGPPKLPFRQTRFVKTEFLIGFKHYHLIKSSIMKQRNSFSCHPVARNRRLSLAILFLLGSVVGMKAQYFNMPVTGFNHDLVANGVGLPSTSATNDLDGTGTGFVFVDGTFKFDAGCAFGPYVTGIAPASNTISSTAAVGLTYTLQSYSGNNALRVPAAGVVAGSGLLTLSTPSSAANLYLLCVSGGGAIASGVTITVNFQDGTNQVFSNQTTTDWCNTTSSGNYTKITTTTYLRAQLTGTCTNLATCQYFAEMSLAIGAGNINKLIVSINVAKTTATNVFSVFALGAKPPCAAPTAQPTSLVLNTISISQIDGSFTAASGPSGYVVVRYPSGSIPTAPTDGTTYTTGQPIGTGVVVTAGTGTSFSASGLTGSTIYDVYVYSYNSGALCGGPIYLSAASLMGSQSTAACGTMSGLIPIGPTAPASPNGFPSLGAALTYIGTNGLGAATILELQTDYSPVVETYPLTFGSNPCVNASRPLTVRPAVGVATPIAFTSASTTGTLLLDGGSYITIDGRPDGTGSSKMISVTNTSATAGSAGNAILLRNEASNNILTYLDLKASNLNPANNSGTLTVGSVPGVMSILSTTGLSGNDNNTISYCDIHSVNTTGNLLNVGIYAYNNTAVGNLSNNDNNSISNNNIYDCFHATTVTAGINVLVGNNSYIITNNSYYKSPASTYAYTGAVSHRGFWITPNASAVASSGFIITGNSIGGTAPNCGGTSFTTTSTAATVFNGMDISVGTFAITSIQNNLITNFNVTTASTSSTAWVGINTAAGRIDCGTVAGNLIGSTSSNSAIVFKTTLNLGGLIGIRASGGNIVNVYNNVISGIDVLGNTVSINPGFNGINGGGATSVNIVDNTIGSSSLANSINAVTATTSASVQTIRGIIVNSGTSSTVIGNLIANMNSNIAYSGGVAHTMAGIAVTVGTSTVSGNTIRNLTSSSQSTSGGSTPSVIGISYTSTTAPALISGNTIHTLKNTASATTSGPVVAGIFYSGAAGAANLIEKNNIHSLVLTSTTVSSAAAITGMDIATGAVTIRNNMIRLGYDENGNSITSPALIRGISKNTNIANVYFNSIYIGGTNVLSTPAANSFAFTRTAAANTDDIRNNIFVNNRSNATSGGKHYQISLSSVSTLNLNYNVYYGAGNGSVFASNVGVDIPAYTVGWVTGDNSSQVGDPQFINSTGDVSTGDLHISLSNQTVAEQNGINIASVTEDLDGQLRSGFTPEDIGADAGNFTPVNACSGTPPPSTATLTNTSVGCGSATKTIYLAGFTSQPGYSFQWQESATGLLGSFVDVTTGSGGNTNTYTTALLNTTTWFQSIVTCTNGGLSTTSSSVLVQINAAPLLVVTPATGTNVCSGSNVDLTASGAVTYSWSANPGLSGYPTVSLFSTANNLATVTSRPTSTLATNTATPPATSATPTWTYTVIGTDAGGCTASTTLTLNVITSATVPLQLTYDYLPNPICEPGIPVTFTINNNGTIGAGNWVYNWYNSAGTTLLQSTTNALATDTYTPPTPVSIGNKQFIVKVSNTVCPSSYAIASPSVFIGFTALAVPTNSNCGDNGTVAVYAEGQTDFSTWYSNNFATGLLGAAFDASYGNTNFTGGRCNITPQSNSQTGTFLVRNPGSVNTNNLQVDFDISTGPRGFAFNILGADGMAWSYGPNVFQGIVNATNTGTNAENGSGSGFKLAFDATANGAQNLPGVYLMYNCTTADQGPTTPGVLAFRQGSFWQGLINAPTTILISENGYVTVTLNNEVIFDHVALPTSYLTTNKSNWIHGFSARTGGSNELHAIDNLNIQYSTFEYSINSTNGNDGSWQIENTFTGLAAGTYPVWVRKVSDPSCFSNTGNVVINVDPSPSSAITVASPGFSDVVCYGNNTTLTTNIFVPGATFLWEESSSVSGPWSTSAGSNGAGTYVTLGLTTNTYYRVTFTCPSSSPVTSTPLIVTVNAGTVVSTNSPQLVNCLGDNVTLSAVPGPNSTMVWYSAANGGSPLFSGNDYIIAPASLPVTYYVEPVTTLYSNHYFNGGQSVITNTLGTTGSSTGIATVFSTTASIVIDSIKVVPGATGTLTVALQNAGSATNIATFNFNVTAAMVGNFVNVPVNLTVAGSGNYQLTTTGVACAYYSTYTGSYAAPYMSLGGVFIITGGGFSATSGGSTSSYGTAFRISISSSCPAGSGARVPVLVQANSANAVVVAPATNTICVGTIQPLSASSAALYTNYSWTPLTDLYDDAAATIPYSGGNSTTVYLKASTAGIKTYTASTIGSGCTNTATTSISVIAAPNVLVSATPSSLCAGGNSQLVASVNGTYCQATYTTGSGASDYITNVTLETINNTTGASAAPYNTYYSSLNANISANSSYTVTGTINNGGTENVAIWIDYNHDGTFGASEKLGEQTGLTFSIGFTVPPSAYNGTTRMRVRNVYSTTNIDPCNSYTFGEVEDYNITISGGVTPGGYTYDWSANPTYLSATNISNPIAQTMVSSQTYTVTVGDVTSGCSSTETVAVVVTPCNSILNLTAFIEGYWDGSSAMLPVLANQGEATTATATDSIDVELRNATAPYAMVQSVRTVLHQDGTAICSFISVSGSYYIVVKHRNAIQTWSAAPVAMGALPASYNFSTAVNQAYGDNQVEVATGIWAFFSGDVEIDENMDLLDLGLVETDINNFEFGYRATDINGDGNVDLLDSPALEANINNFIFSNHP